MSEAKRKNIREILIALAIFVFVMIILGAVTLNAAETNTIEDRDFKYKVLEDGTIGITEYLGTATEVIIPETIDGKTVTSITANAFQDCTYLKEIIIPEGVISINYASFAGCTNLMKVEIPSSVTIIGEYVFYNCTSLTNIVIPSSVTIIGKYAFYNCTSLTNIVIPENVTKIENATFEYCENLTDINIPKGVVSIGRVAFAGCTRLANVELPDSVVNIEGMAFAGCNSFTNIKIPSTVMSIEGTIFLDCENLISVNVATDNEKYSSENGVLFDKEKTKIIYYPAGRNKSTYSIPDSVTTIEYFAFYGCTKLSEITIPDGVTGIGNWAFGYCTSLSEIIIPVGVTNIGSGTFDNCENLSDIIVASNNENYSSNNGVLFNKEKTEIIRYPEGKKDNIYTIPESVNKIQSKSFYRCNNLVEITIPKEVISIEVHAFSQSTKLDKINVVSNNENYSSENGVLFNKQRTKIIKYPEGKQDITYKIPEGVTIIGYKAFEYCTKLKEVIIPNSVASIENRAFENCENLTEVIIPNSVTNIGGWVFENCISLTDIEIPSSVTEIGSSVFYGCVIYKAVENNLKTIQEIELPEIIIRTMNKDDILYNEEDFSLANCSFNKDKTKLVVDTETIKGENTFLAIDDGTLAGLKFVIIPVGTIESEKYKIGEIYITKIFPKTMVKKLKENIETNTEDIKIYSKENEEIGENELVGTGMQIKLKIGNETKTFLLVVAGDVNGDGEARLSDMTIINRYRLHKRTLEGEALVAGEVTGDGVVDIKDIVKINRYRLHKIAEF